AEAVDFDVAAGADAEFAGVLAVVLVGIGEMQGAMKLARGVFVINDVKSFGSFVVTLALLGAHGLAAERDLVRFQYRTATHQRQRALALFNDDAIGLFGRRGSGASRGASEKKKNGRGE